MYNALPSAVIYGSKEVCTYSLFSCEQLTSHTSLEMLQILPPNVFIQRCWAEGSQPMAHTGLALG